MAPETKPDRMAPRRQEERGAEHEDEPRRADEQEYVHKDEIGSTSGRTHADILEATLPHDLAQKSAVKRDRNDIES